MDSEKPPGKPEEMDWSGWDDLPRAPDSDAIDAPAKNDALPVSTVSVVESRPEAPGDGCSPDTADPDTGQVPSHAQAAPDPDASGMNDEVVVGNTGLEASVKPDKPFHFEPRCHICRLPPEVRDRARDLKFRDNKSNARIAAELEAMLKQIGVAGKVGIRNLSTHFAHHGPGDEQITYRWGALGRGGHSLSLGRTPEEVVATLRDLRFRDLRERIDMVADSLTDLYEEDAVALKSRGFTMGSDYRDRAYAMHLKLAKATTSTIELARRIGDPKEVIETALALVQGEYGASVKTRLGAFMQEFTSTVFQRVDPSLVAELQPELNQMLEALIADLRELERRSQDQLRTVLEGES